MAHDLIIYRNLEFDGTILVRYDGHAPVQSIHYQLLRDGTLVAEQDAVDVSKSVRFVDQPPGKYQATAQLTHPDGTTSHVSSMQIDITTGPALRTLLPAVPRVAVPDTEPSLKGGHRFYDNVANYYLEVKLKPDSFARLRSESLPTLANFLRSRSALHFTAVFPPEVTSKRGRGHLADLYRIDGPLPRTDLISIAQELELLDYVIYCSVTPDTTGMAPPESPPRVHAEHAEPSPPFATADTTPDFTFRQTYLDEGNGMNVRNAWALPATGLGATIRHLDFGVYRHHEDLGNITVVNSRPETEDCNHGTASTGCIAATKNGFGVTGIAYEGRFFFYDTGDLDKIVRDVEEGDIVGLDIQFSVNGKLLPVIDSKSWWDKINALTRAGATVILAAGNGGLDLAPAAGNLYDFGNSGSLLAGACSHDTGRRAYFSNYGHYTSLINSWGDWSVATTGYGGLQTLPGNNRNYTSSFSGTSSATPLSVGAVGVLQGYLIQKYGLVLPAKVMIEVLSFSGYMQGLPDGIGRRPNVWASIDFLTGPLT